MGKIAVILTLLFLAFFCFNVSSETLSELTFEDLFVDPLIVNNPNASACTVIDFVFPETTFNSTDIVYLVLNSNFQPVNAHDVVIEVFLQDSEEPLTFLRPANFVENQSRVPLPLKHFNSGENSIKVCLKNDSESVQSSILSNSFIGFYSGAWFNESNFSKTLLTYNPEVGEQLRVAVELKNVGSLPGEIDLNANVIRMRHIEFIDGNTSFTSVIQPNETVLLEYFILAKQPVNLTLLSAKVEFENPFGEIISLDSSRPTLNVSEREIKLRAFVLADKKNIKPNEPLNIRFAVTNEDINPLFNIVLELESNGLSFEKQRFSITSLQPSQTTYLETIVFADTEGTYNLSCNLLLLDYDFFSQSCEPVEIVVQKTGLPSTLIFAVIITILGVIVYFYLSRR
ncbi:MAG: hypothetical protein ABH821_02220 [archaeon]